MTLRRLKHVARGDKSATRLLLKLTVCSRGQRPKTAMFFAPFAPPLYSGMTHWSNQKIHSEGMVPGSATKSTEGSASGIEWVHVSLVTQASTAALSLLQASRRSFFLPLNCCTTSSSRSGAS